MHSAAFRLGIGIFLTAALPFSATAQSAPQAGHAAQPVAVSRESLAGLYDGGQMEVAAQLLLEPNGRFKYELSYGALDEAAEGTWELKDGAVFLTTLPAVVPPQFVVVSDTPEPQGGLWIKLEKPVIEGAPQRVYLVYGAGEPAEMAEVVADGRVPLPDGRRPTGIIPAIPVYPTMSKLIPLTGTGGHRLLLRFEPHDIGKADFRGQRLGIEGGVLLMPRRDLELMLRFKRQRGRAK